MENASPTFEIVTSSFLLKTMSLFFGFQASQEADTRDNGFDLFLY